MPQRRSGTLTNSFSASSAHILVCASHANRSLLCCFFSPETGVYKSQEARLMLLMYHVKASTHTTLSKASEETWSLDGFVSLL